MATGDRAEITTQREHAARVFADSPDIAHFNSEWEALHAIASAVDHDEIRNRFQDLTRSNGLPLGDAEIELLARLT